VAVYTGIKINRIEASEDALIERIRNERTRPIRGIESSLENASRC
jgi:hypothetical protein